MGDSGLFVLKVSFAAGDPLAEVRDGVKLAELPLPPIADEGGTAAFWFGMLMNI